MQRLCRSLAQTAGPRARPPRRRLVRMSPAAAGRDRFAQVPDVSVTLLGGFAAAVDGVAVPESGLAPEEGARAREAARARAAATGSTASRRWTCSGATAARPRPRTTSTRRCTSRAGRSAPEAIESRDEVLSLAAEIDVDRFELAAADARRVRTPAAYRAALALYGGELLPENRYDDWAETRRDELAALAAELARGGRRARLGDGRSALPADASSFVGREPRAGRAAGRCCGGRGCSPLPARAAPGKTRLALELARGAEPAYRGGRRARRARRARRPAARPGRRRRRARRARAAGQELVDAVIDFLAPRTLLLVLDNCEHLLARDGGARRTRCFARRRRLTIVATSREPLRVPGEVVFRVPSLDIPDPEQPLSPPELLASTRPSRSSSSARRRVAGLRARRARTRRTSRASASASTACRSRSSSPPAGSERSARRRSRSGSTTGSASCARGSHAAPTRQQTLTATLQWSHDLLEPDERILFRRLAIFAGSFELEAVEERLRGRRPRRLPAIADVLGAPREKSLVTVEERGPRTAATGCSRRFACTRASASPRPARSRRSPSGTPRWALALAERERGSPRLDRDAANLRAALDTLLDTRPARRAPAVRRAAAVLAAADRSRRGEAALRGGARRRSRADDAPRRGAARRGCDRLPQRHARPGLRARRGRATPSPSEIGDTAARVACAAVPRRVRGRERRGRRRSAAGSSVRSRSRDASASQPREAIGVHSLGVAQWILGDLASADELVGREHRAFPRARRLAGHDSLTAQHRGDPDEPARTGRSGLRHVFEDTLQPCVEISCDARRQLRAGEPGRRSRAPAATSTGRARCSTRAAAVSTAQTTTPGSGDGSRPARVHLARRGRLAAARAHLETRARAARRG